MKLSIRNKILLGFAIILILSYSEQTLGFLITQRYVYNQTKSVLDERVQNALTQIQNFTAKIELNHLGIAREYNHMVEGNTDKVIDTINYTLRQNDFFRRITILSLTGRELIKVDRFYVTPSQELSFEIPTDSFRAAIVGNVGVSKVYFSEPENLPQMDFYTPLFSDTGTPVAVIKGQLRLNRLWDLIAEVKLGKSGFAYVVDEEGRLIAHPNFNLVLAGPNFSDRPTITALLSGMVDSQELNHTYINEKNVEVVSSGLNIPQLNWIVVVEQPIREAYNQLYVLRNLFFTTLLGSFLLLILISFILSENFSQPIRKLTYFTDLVKQGNLEDRIIIKSGDEIEDLGNSLNVMVSQLKHNLSQLKDKITQLETQKKRLDLSAQLLLRRDLDVREINAELEKEKELISSERNKLAVILSGIRDAVIACDLTRKIILFNTAAERLFGYTAQEVLGQPIDTIITVFDRGEELSPTLYCPIRNDGFEGTVFSKKNLEINNINGQSNFVNLISAKIKESNLSQLGCIITFHNVSEERRLEEMKLDFVSMAAHELRTPLTSIRGYAQTLQEELAALPPQQKESVDRLVVSAKTLSDLIDNLLNVSRIEQGTFKVDVVATDMTEVIENTLKGFREVANVKNQKLVYDPLDEKLPFVLADPLRIGQVLSNLLANAVTYTPPHGTITVSVMKNHVQGNPREQFIISVKDTGQGIPKAAQPRLFTKFFRVSGALEQGSKGTGLGLFISKSIVEMHRGKIWVDSDLGKGAKFYFSLPIAQQEIERFTKSEKTVTLPGTDKHGIILNTERMRRVLKNNKTLS